MTSLIDVIFLLLLFFMLTSTFSRFGEIPVTLGGGAATASVDATQLFLRITEHGTSVNGRAVPESSLVETVGAQGDVVHFIVSASDDATAQSLATVLHILRGVSGAQVVVLQ